MVVRIRIVVATARGWEVPFCELKEIYCYQLDLSSFASPTVIAIHFFSYLLIIYSGSSEGRLTQPPSIFRLPSVTPESVSFEKFSLWQSSFYCRLNLEFR